MSEKKNVLWSIFFASSAVTALLSRHSAVHFRVCSRPAPPPQPFHTISSGVSDPRGSLTCFFQSHPLPSRPAPRRSVTLAVFGQKSKGFGQKFKNACGAGASKTPSHPTRGPSGCLAHLPPVVGPPLPPIRIGRATPATQGLGRQTRSSRSRSPAGGAPAAW